MLRRRLSRLSALTVSVAHSCLQDDRNVPVVFASQHGELARTADLLVAIAREEPLSPTAFSLSVHNSASGLLTLTRTERAPATAIAAGHTTLAMGLLEAISQSHACDGRAVLLVCADALPPDPYRGAISDAVEYAFALIVEAEGELSMETSDGELPGNLSEQVAGLAALLRGEQQFARLGDGSQGWRISRA